MIFFSCKIHDQWQVSCFAEEGQVLHETKGVQSLAQVRSEIYADLSEVSPQLSVDRQHGNLKQPIRWFALMIQIDRISELLKRENEWVSLLFLLHFENFVNSSSIIFEESSSLVLSQPAHLPMSNLIQSIFIVWNKNVTTNLTNFSIETAIWKKSNWIGFNTIYPKNVAIWRTFRVQLLVENNSSNWLGFALFS